ncbi:MAG: glycosyltransferase [Gammaproteobacteria bacterium]
MQNSRVPSDRKPILLMAGGTGGHIYPALAVALRLREMGVPLLWLGSRRGLENRIVPPTGIKLLTIAVSGLRGRGWAGALFAPFKLTYAVLQALRIIWQSRPAAVLGMGGFASGPGGVAAWMLRIPLLIHEQNAIAGYTNRLLAPLATRLMQAFPVPLIVLMRCAPEILFAWRSPQLRHHRENTTMPVCTCWFWAEARVQGP